MDFSTTDQAEFGWMLMIGGVICFLVWFALHFLWAIGLAFIVAGAVLYLSAKATPKKRRKE